MKTLYTAHVSITSGRDGAARAADGQLDVRLGFPKELGGNGTGTNPEQLFAAGYAACFASSLKAAAARHELKAPKLRIEAEASLGVRDDGSYAIGSVRLRIFDAGFGDRAAEILAEAKRICAYSNATRGNVALDAQFADA